MDWVRGGRREFRREPGEALSAPLLHPIWKQLEKLLLHRKGLRPSRQPARRLSGGFRRHSVHRFLPLSIASALLLLAAFWGPVRAAAKGGSFKPQTMAAFAAYVRSTDARNDSELQAGRNFLWIDALPEAARQRAYQSLGAGEAQIERRNTLADGREIPCPGGMIHHWEGLIFIPRAHLDEVLKILQDYDHHSVYYAPDVTRSQLEAHDGDHFRAFLRFRRQKVITVVLNTEHDIHYFRDQAQRAHSRSSATHIAEVANAGQPDEREKPRDDDNGFLWGMETWWRLEEKEGGVYVQSEVVSVTRDIPAGLGWMIGSFITSIPKDTLGFTLAATRQAVLARRNAQSQR